MGRLGALLNLSGRVAVVTGGSRGLGMQIAEALGKFGAEVALISRKMADLDEAKDRMSANGAKVHAVAANLADHGVIAALADDIGARFGRVDILVNNAGTTWGAPAEDHPLDAWTKIIDLNVTGLFLLSRMTAGTLARWKERLIDNTPLGKLGRPDDRKGVALLLASDAGGHVSGQTIGVEGGAAII